MLAILRYSIRTGLRTPVHRWQLTPYVRSPAWASVLRSGVQSSWLPLSFLDQPLLVQATGVLFVNALSS